MAKSTGQKLKLLHIIRILEENSDENHPISTIDLIEKLDQIGIHSERKSIYDDIAKLCDFGYDIITVQNRLGGGYYLAQREFELPELKLLVDAVTSSKFVTTKKSRELISKLEKKVSRYDGGKLQRQVYVAGRVKTENESIYYSVDTIHEAIQENRKISFVYLDWSLNKELVPRANGNKTVSPFALIWNDENYYLAAFDDTDRIIKHYRVDKMGSVTILEEKRTGKEQFDKIDLASYSNRTFGMFGGKEETVTLRFPNQLIGVVIDRFGKEVSLRSDGDSFFMIRTNIVVSNQFFSWVAGIGKAAQIIKPDKVRNDYFEWLKNLSKEEIQ